jgi:hypothetical protein
MSMQIVKELEFSEVFAIFSILKMSLLISEIIALIDEQSTTLDCFIVLEFVRYNCNTVL